MENSSKSDCSVVPPEEMRADDDELAKLLAGVVGAVEATLYEKHTLWREYATASLKLWGQDLRRRYSWEAGLSGLGHGVGEIDDRPVVLRLLVDTVAGHRILFWHCTSQVVDYAMVEKWLDEVLPDRKNGDPMNFHHLLSSLPDKVRLFCRTNNIDPSQQSSYKELL